MEVLPDGTLVLTLDVVDPTAVKVSVTTVSLAEINAACESVNVVSEIAETKVLLAILALPVTFIPTKIAGFTADKVTVVLEAVKPVAVVVCVVEPAPEELVPKVRVKLEDTVAACESVKVVPEIAETVVPVGIPEVAVTDIPAKIAAFAAAKVTVVLPDTIPVNGASVVELVAKESVSAAVVAADVAVESVNVVPEFVTTVVPGAMPVPLTYIPAEIAAFAAAKVIVVLLFEKPVAVVVAVVAYDVAKARKSVAGDADVPVAACESVKVVPEIAETVVLVGISVPNTYIPGTIAAFAAAKVTMVLPFTVPESDACVVEYPPMETDLPDGIQTLFDPFGIEVAAVVFVSVPSTEVPQFPGIVQSTLNPPVNT
jgi:hypothetical protein